MKTPGSFLFTLAAAAVLLFATAVQAQKSGQSVQIQYGVVVGSTYVKEKSNAATGALIGGAIGLLVGKGKSTSTKVATTAVGAGLGGVTASKMQGDRNARQYTVATSSGQVTIISDQVEIQVDDCVVVENPGTTSANIRRVSSTFCHPDSAEVVASLSDEMQEEAAECVAAKQELVAAETDAAVDRALRKMSILCDD
ncbi:MAG TPA: hypothetical protein VKN35_06320 [Xanthomonadales bacterium]|nr:hypothetical protein [Xanthomonadales bacterium]